MSIRINKKWSVKRDRYQWTLEEHGVQIDRKTGEEKPKIKEWHFPWLDQAMNWAAERDCEGAEAFSDVQKAYIRLKYDLRDCVSVWGRVYGDIHSELLETRKRLRNAEMRLKEGQNARR